MKVLAVRVTAFNLILEVTGEKKKDKAAKVATARNLWLPAVNNDGRFGRWAFIEIDDPWDAANLIRTLYSVLSTQYKHPEPSTLNPQL